MKTAGILFVFAASICAGCYASYNIKAQCRTVRLLETLLEDFMIYIRYQSLPMEDLLALFAEHENYQEIAFLQRVRAAFRPEMPSHLLWCEEVRRDGQIVPPAQEILCALGNVLGTTDVQGQLTALETHRLQMHKLADTMQENCQKKGALYRHLGLLAGAMLAVLLL